VDVGMRWGCVGEEEDRPGRTVVLVDNQVWHQLLIDLPELRRNLVGGLADI